jgi:translation initiation factor IF-3
MTKENPISIPYLDPSVQHVGISKLRALNVTQLRDLDKTLVIQDNDKPLAVLLKYEHFMAIQERLRSENGD